MLNEKKVGFAITGSHCTISQILPKIDELIKSGAEVQCIISESVKFTDTRFGSAAEWKKQIEAITGKEIISTIVDAEPIGPQGLFDIIIVAPCSGNTLAKFANGITDGPVLMAMKAHLRNIKPIVLGISTNDALSINSKNLGLVLNFKNVYFIPFGQDNPEKKPNSLVADYDKIKDTLELALEGKQIQPILCMFNN